MKKLLCALLLTTTIIYSAFANENWGYGPTNGPATWGKEYTACQPGGYQSPVNLTTIQLQSMKYHRLLKFSFKAPADNIVNNGHTIQVNFPPSGNSITIGLTTYRLVQLHFHSPSENTIDRHHFPLEMHLVLSSPNGNLAVVAVFFKAGTANPAITTLWQHIPTQAGGSYDLSKMNIDYSALLPQNLRYEKIEGSLTTPPCTRHVPWHILITPATMSTAQINEFRKYYSGNNRPVQG